MVRSAHFGLIPLMVAQSDAGADDRAAVLLALCRCAAGAHRALPGRRFPPLTYYQLWHDLTHASASGSGCASRCATWRATSPATACCSAAAGREARRAAGGRRVGPCRLISVVTARADRIALHGDLLDFVAEPGMGRGRVAGGALPARPLAADRGRPHRRRAAPRRPTRAGTRHDHARPARPARLHRHPRAQPAARRDRELRHRAARLADDAHLPGRGAPRRPGARRGRRGAASSTRCSRHGTTSAVRLPDRAQGSVDALFAAAQARGMRAHRRQGADGPPCAATACATTSPGRARDGALIARWHGRGRLAYAVTVRFAPTSSPEQLALAGRLCRADPSLYMQTHLAENRAEVRWVHELFPEARSYLDVYAARRPAACEERVRARHLARRRRPRRAARRPARRSRTARRRTCSSAAACSTGAPPRRPASQVSLASDVGGGTSLSMLRNMADAYKVQALAGQRLTAWKALHAATRGAAQRARARRTRSARSSRARGRRVRLGLGRRRRSRRAATRWRAACMSGCSRG